jgi:phosphoribosylformylglycinamidine cyclo-ligase/phosphoribosylamine--glycine ligase/phosphoribosylformylglycinamidine cyclo-ligase
MSTAYAESGVSIDAGNRAVELMREAVRATYNDRVLGGIGSFGGLYDARALQEMRAPVLVASTDGVGTKVKVAAQAGRYENIGRDLVNHCINDILVQGARPLFFLDYIASSKLVPEHVAAIVTSMADACREANMALLGGETAEMPGVYLPNEFDVAGTILGVVERDNMLPRGDVQRGDVLIGLASDGPHTNGYSLLPVPHWQMPCSRPIAPTCLHYKNSSCSPLRSRHWRTSQGGAFWKTCRACCRTM